MNYKVKCNEIDEVVSLVDTMTRYKDLQFNVKHGNTVIDGKSIVSMMYVASCNEEFTIYVIGSDSQVNEWYKSVVDLNVGIAEVTP